MKYTYPIFLFMLIGWQALAQSPTRKGKDYAIFFYVTSFDNGWQELEATKGECERIATELKTNFGFQAPEIYREMTLKQIRDKLKEINNRRYEENDQLLFFFSMHGHYDDNAEAGYLVPRDGDLEDFTTWLSYAELRTFMVQNKCKHIYLALDACHSGSFKVGDKAKPDKAIWEQTPDCTQRVTEALRYKSRIFAASGSKLKRTPAQSLFASKFLETLRRGGEEGIIKADELNLKLMQINTPKPQTGTFTGNEEGGEFIFVRKDACANQKPFDDIEMDKADWKIAKASNTIAAYEKYKRDRPNGIYVEEATDAINRIKNTPVNTNPIQTYTPPSVSSLAFEPEMVKVTGGTFQMGSNEYDDEKPIHSVYINSFYIGKYEVTQKQWRDVMGNDPPELNFKGCDNCPVERVSWNDIQEYLKKLNTKTGKNYRLPTEAEWEYAAKGGNLSKGYKYSGSDNLAAVAWFWENSGDKKLSGEWSSDAITKNNCKTHPVGGKQPNELGLYDMSGNVWEWCSDWYGAYSSGSQQNPTGATTGSSRVNRGGSWYNSAELCRPTFRGGNTPSNRYGYLGFRVCYSLQ